MLVRASKIKSTVLDLLYPRFCVGCGREGAFVCPECYRSLRKIVPPVCPLCGRPQASGVLCSHCVGWQTSIDGIRSPFQFEGTVRDAIHQLKYRNLRAIAGTLAGFLCDYYQASPLPADFVVPVPMHPGRLKERGYNQTGLLARELSTLIGLPLISNCLIRTKAAYPQARTASVKQRWDNMVGAFACRYRILKGKRVLLIDDVTTSGATLDACAVAIKEAGAASVWGLVLAREI